CDGPGGAAVMAGLADGADGAGCGDGAVGWAQAGLALLSATRAPAASWKSTPSRRAPGLLGMFSSLAVTGPPENARAACAQELMQPLSSSLSARGTALIEELSCFAAYTV